MVQHEYFDNYLSKWVLGVYRYGRRIRRIKRRWIRAPLILIYRVLDLIVVRGLGSAEIPPTCVIGEGVKLLHGGNGIIIHGNAVIGNNVTIMHQVTLGRRNVPGQAPIVEDDVIIGAGAKILGGVRIGRGAKIGANAVVLTDVPAEATAVGVPARIIPPKESPGELEMTL